MSTGIGNHEYVKRELEVRMGDDGRKTTAYTIYKAICPYCSCPECEADHVDVGVGLVQCGPYYCPDCGASEISSRDTRSLNPEEERTGWYMPHSPVSEIANTVNGILVDHQTAAKAQERGCHDPSPPGW